MIRNMLHFPTTYVSHQKVNEKHLIFNHFSVFKITITRKINFNNLRPELNYQTITSKRIIIRTIPNTFHVKIEKAKFSGLMCF